MVGFPNQAKQLGLTLSGLTLALIAIGLAAVIGIQVVPALVEYQSIKTAMVDSRNSGNTAAEIQAAFNRQARAGYISTIRGEDLTIVKKNDDFIVSFAYDKKLHLMGPVSLLLEFSGSTDKSPQLKN